MSHPSKTALACGILFVCTGNICRSPMAEGLLKSMWPQNINRPAVIESAGTHAMDGLPAEPYAIQVAGEFGADIRSHRSRALTPALVEKADLILAMAQEHVNVIQKFVRGTPGAVHLLAEFNPDNRRSDVPDPYGDSLETYRKCADMIHGFLGQLISEMRGLAEGR